MGTDYHKIMNIKSKYETRKERESDGEGAFYAVRDDSPRNDMSKSKRRAIKITNIVGIVLSVLCFISASAAINFLRPVSESKDIYEMLGAEVDTAALSSREKIFDSDNPIPKQLSELILSDEVRVYKSDSMSFVMAEDKVDKDDLSELSEKIGNASEDESEGGEAVVYYMILFSDKRTVLFSLSETALEVYGKKYRL